MAYKINGTPLSMDVPFRDSSGNQYPSNWLRLVSKSDREAIGITEVAEPDDYDQEFYWSKDNPKDHATLKALWVETQKSDAAQILSKTDWYVTRKAEASTAIPSAIATYRTAVRTKSKEREDQINATSNTAALATLCRADVFLEGTASNGATEKKKEDGSSYDPKQWNYDAPNPAALKAWPTEPS